MNNSVFNLCTQDLGGACLLQTPSLPMPPALELESMHEWALWWSWGLESWSMTLAKCSQLSHQILSLNRVHNEHFLPAAWSQQRLSPLEKYPDFKLFSNAHVTFVALAVANFCMFDLYDNWITCPLPFLAYYISTRCRSQCLRTQQALNKHLLNEWKNVHFIMDISFCQWRD